jgi:hypothetical protein
VVATETVTASGVVTEPGPVWWSDEMTQDEEGNWWPPEEVKAMVKEHYLTYVAARESVLFEDGLPNLDALEAVTYEWYSGPQLETELRILEDQRNGGIIHESDIEDIHLDVQNWSADGLQCTLGATLQGIRIRGYSAHNGELIETAEMDSQLILWRMQYDSQNGHWKMHELIDFYD